MIWMITLQDSTYSSIYHPRHLTSFTYNRRPILSKILTKSNPDSSLIILTIMEISGGKLSLL